MYNHRCEYRERERSGSKKKKNKLLLGSGEVLSLAGSRAKQMTFVLDPPVQVLTGETNELTKESSHNLPQHSVARSV